MPSYPDLWIVLGDARPEDPLEVGSWRTSLVPLAVRRGRPLLGVAGIPTPIAAQPASLTRIARRLIHRLGAIPYRTPFQLDAQGHWIDEAFTGAATAELAVAIAQLSRAYGPTAARELVEWLIRNEVRWAIREHWWAWSCFFTDVASDRAQLPPALGARSGVVQQLIEATFARPVKERLWSQEAIAKAIPLSRMERRLVAYEEIPDEPPMSVDVVADLALAAEREQARLVYQILAAALTEPELDALTESARARTGNTSL